MAVPAISPPVASVGGAGEAAESRGGAQSPLQVDATVHPAGKYSQGVLRWGYFLVLNAVAGTLAAAIFVGVFFADSLDPYFQGTYDWLLAHPGVTSAMAFSPLACSLLVGYGYGQRARRRKQAAARREEMVKSKLAEREAAVQQAGAPLA